MEDKSVEEILKKAAAAVEALPEALQGKAFELAVSMLTGEQVGAPERSAGTRPASRESVRPPDGAPDVADLLRVSKRNTDRYLVFAQDLEGRAEPATTAAFLECFRRYRQDAPKLPSRDLGDLVAKSLLEQVGKGRDSTYVLKRKGRERLAQLLAASTAE